MSESLDQGTVAIQAFRGILIAPLQTELTPGFRRRLREALLDSIRRTGADRVIVNASGLDVMDLHEFESLRRTIRMAQIMGARCVLTGLQPGIVSALVELDADVDGLETALNVEQALALLSPDTDESADAEEDAELTASDARDGDAEDHRGSVDA